MGDFTKIEVGKIFPGPVPAIEGAQMELWHDMLTMLIQIPGLSQDQLRSFNKGFKQYSYLESDTPIPIALWIFDFPAPHRLIGVPSMQGSLSANGLIYTLIPVTMVPKKQSSFFFWMGRY